MIRQVILTSLLTLVLSNSFENLKPPGLEGHDNPIIISLSEIKEDDTDLKKKIGHNKPHAKTALRNIETKKSPDSRHLIDLYKNRNPHVFAAGKHLYKKKHDRIDEGNDPSNENRNNFKKFYDSFAKAPGIGIKSPIDLVIEPPGIERHVPSEIEEKDEISEKLFVPDIVESQIIIQTNDDGDDKEIEMINSKNLDKSGFVGVFGLSRIFNAIMNKNANLGHHIGEEIVIQKEQKPIIHSDVQSHVINSNKKDAVKNPNEVSSHYWIFREKDLSTYSKKPNCDRIKQEMNFIFLYNRLFPHNWDSRLKDQFHKLDEMFYNCETPGGNRDLMFFSVSVGIIFSIVFLVLFIVGIYYAVRAYRKSCNQSYVKIGVIDN